MNDSSFKPQESISSLVFYALFDTYSRCLESDTRPLSAMLRLPAGTPDGCVASWAQRNLPSQEESTGQRSRKVLSE